MTGLAVSVIIPTLGRRDLLERCLRSVLACDPAPDEVVVVDQSDGAAVAVLIGELHALLVRRVECDGRGVARAMNVGLAAVRHDTVLVTHDDCTVAADWVGVAVRHAEAHRGGIITGRVLPPDGSPYVPSTKSDPRPKDFTGMVTSGVLYPANMVASRRELQAIGGFDERRSLLVAEDNDLCYRWLTDGRGFRYEPDLVVWHHDWRTPVELVRTHIAYARAQGGFYAKHLHAVIAASCAYCAGISARGSEAWCSARCGGSRGGRIRTARWSCRCWSVCLPAGLSLARFSGRLVGARLAGSRGRGQAAHRSGRPPRRRRRAPPPARGVPPAGRPSGAGRSRCGTRRRRTVTAPAATRGDGAAAY